MLIVGLTGGIASGKSTVSTLLQAAGLPLVDLDVLAREAVAPHSYALSALAKHFGPTIVLPDGSLDRAALGAIVFVDDKQRRVLNSITHPAVRRLLAWALVKAWLRGDKVCVVDAPLLIEAGLWKFCGAIIVVYCSEALQLQRLCSRNDFTSAEASARIRSQAPLASKLVYADYVIDNSGPLPDLTAQVDRIVLKLTERAGWSWVLDWLVPPYGLFRGAALVAWRLWFKGVGKERRPGNKTRGERKGEDIELRDRSAKSGSRARL